MSTNTKTSLKLPIFLMVAPALLLILTFFIYAVVNFIFSGVTAEPIATSDMSISEGASIAEGANTEAELFGEPSLVSTISNIVLFLVGAISVLAFVPCLVFGIILLNKRRNPEPVDAPITNNKENRNWGDLE